MIKKYFRRDANVLVDADSYIIKDLDKYFNYYFDNEFVHYVGSDIWYVMLRDREDSYIQMELKKIIIKQFSEPDVQIFFDGDKKKIGLIKENTYEWQFQNLQRIVRILLRLQCQEMGDIFLHGGCISYEGKGICFLGDKKSGKTSSILSFLKNKESAFISNDDVSIHKGENNWYAEGWPRSVVIRSDTWEKLGLENNNLIHPLNSTKEVICLYPQQIGELFGKKNATGNLIDYVVFPQFTDDKIPQIIHIDREEAKKRVRENVLYNPGKYNEYLLPYFEKSKGEMTNEFLQGITFLELRQNFDNLEEATNILSKLIDKEIKNAEFN